MVRLLYGMLAMQQTRPSIRDRHSLLTDRRRCPFQPLEPMYTNLDLKMGLLPPTLGLLHPD